MKKIFSYISVTFVMFSCIKDAEHQLQEKYVAIDIEKPMNVSSSIVRFSAFVSNYGDEEILDHGFIWGTRETSFSFLTDEDLDKWIKNGNNKIFREFLIEKGTTISLGKLEKIGQFTYDANIVVIGRKYFVMAYIKTNNYVMYSKVDFYENNASLAKKTRTFRMPNSRYFTVNGKIFILSNSMVGLYNSIGELKQVHNNYTLDVRTNIPVSINTFYFSIGDFAYFSLNNNNMIKYNVVKDTWTTVMGNPNIPSYRIVTLSFTLDQKGYSVIDNYIYEFDPVCDVWAQKNKSGITAVIYPECVFQYRGVVFAYDFNQLWYYDENLATFQIKSSYNKVGNGISFVTLNDVVYMISESGSVFDIYVFDPENNSAEKLCTVHNYYPNSINTNISFNNKILFLSSVQDNCLYELDILKLK